MLLLFTVRLDKDIFAVGILDCLFGERLFVSWDLVCSPREKQTTTVDGIGSVNTINCIRLFKTQRLDEEQQQQEHCHHFQ